MKKNLFLLTISLLTFQVGYSQTNVSGGIYANSTWTLSGSPYNIIDNVVVFPNVTLTIQPGVVVRFSDTKGLEIRGHISSLGQLSDSIFFTSASTNPSMAIWPGIDFSGTIPGTGTFDYCVFKYADNAINLDWGWGGNGPISVSHSMFYKNSSGVYGYGGFTFVVDSCSFLNNYYGLHGTNFAVSNSTFQNSVATGIDGGSSNVTNSFFCGNSIGVQISGNLQNCIVANNDLGIDNGCNPTNNIIVYNNTGIRVFNSFGINNIICKNYNYNIENVNANSINASNNCWCTTDSLDIAQKIYDGYDNVSLGLVNFTPYTNCDTSAIPTILNCSSILTGVTQTTSTDIIVKLFPNPFNQYATLEFENPKNEKHSFLVYNTFGQLLLSFDNITTGQIKIGKTNLTDGLYFFQLRADRQVIATGKFIIE